METTIRLPKFITSTHETRRRELIEFPGIGISSFVTRELSYNKMNEILTKLKPYYQYYNRMNELFTIEKQYRKCLELQYH